MSDSDSPDLSEIRIPITEGDSWEKIKPFLMPFRPEGCDNAVLDANEASLERDRISHAKRLIGEYFREKGYTIHPNTDPGEEEIFGLGSPIESRKICFPRHIMTGDPNEDIAGKSLILRRDIPILYTLSGFAHEAAHLERYEADDAVVRVLDKMIEDKYLETEDVEFQVNEDGKITPDSVEEEVATDTQAYFLLRDLGIEVEPENYCTYVGRHEDYQTVVFNRIKEKCRVKK